VPYIEYDEVEAICPDCGRTFRSEEALTTHLQDSHAGRDEGPTAIGSLVCPTCHRRADSEAALRAHVARIHPSG
jgi:hypothetical protein